MCQFTTEMDHCMEKVWIIWNIYISHRTQFQDSSYFVLLYMYLYLVLHYERIMQVGFLVNVCSSSIVRKCKIPSIYTSFHTHFHLERHCHHYIIPIVKFFCVMKKGHKIRVVTLSRNISNLLSLIKNIDCHRLTTKQVKCTKE